MNYLLDSHAFIWSVIASNNLSRNSKLAIEDPQSEIFVSYLTFWEISIKQELGKINLHGSTPDDFAEWCEKLDFKILPLTLEDVSTFYRLPRSIHKDPFDRMLVWQAIIRQFTLVSKDQVLQLYKPYGLKMLW